MDAQCRGGCGSVEQAAWEGGRAVDLATGHLRAAAAAPATPPPPAPAPSFLPAFCPAMPPPPPPSPPTHPPTPPHTPPPPHLRDCVVVGPLDEDGAGVGVAHVLNKRELVLPQHVLVHQPCVPQAVGVELLHCTRGGRGRAAASSVCHSGQQQRPRSSAAARGSGRGCGSGRPSARAAACGSSRPHAPLLTVKPPVESCSRSALRRLDRLHRRRRRGQAIQTQVRRLAKRQGTRASGGWLQVEDSPQARGVRVSTPGAHRSARMPSFASMSSDPGSMPFWLMMANVEPSAHTCGDGQGREQAGRQAGSRLFVPSSVHLFKRAGAVPAVHARDTCVASEQKRETSSKTSCFSVGTAPPLQRGYRRYHGGAHLLLEVDDALHLVVGHGALGGHQLLALLGAAVEEAGVDLRGDASGGVVRERFESLWRGCGLRFLGEDDRMVVRPAQTMRTARHQPWPLGRCAAATGMCPCSTSSSCAARAARTSLFSYSSEMLQLRMWQFSRRLGMSGWRDPWSSTRPLQGGGGGARGACVGQAGAARGRGHKLGMVRQTRFQTCGQGRHMQAAARSSVLQTGHRGSTARKASSAAQQAQRRRSSAPPHRMSRVSVSSLCRMCMISTCCCGRDRQ